nr:MAG: hypothetical protein [Bacteriophage sp.]
MFDFNYPLYDPQYKSVLETKIMEHYWFREIGLETYGKFKFFLNRKLNEIMPYYNQLYKSATIEFNPMHDTDLGRKNGKTRGEERTKLSTTNNKSNSITDSKNDIVVDSTETGKSGTGYSDTPQGQIDNVKDLKYLTTYTNVDSSATGKSTTKNSGNTKVDSSGNTNVKDKENANTTENYVETVTGKTGGGSFSSYLQEYRDTFLNIDMMIIEELSELFMNIY